MRKQNRKKTRKRIGSDVETIAVATGNTNAYWSNKMQVPGSGTALDRFHRLEYNADIRIRIEGEGGSEREPYERRRSSS